MKKNIIRAILILLILTVFYIIFYFSSKNAKESSSQSGIITEFVVNNVESIKKLDKPNQDVARYKIEASVRKLAHFAIYAFLGFLLMTFISTYDIKEIKRLLISLLIGSIYSMTDEFHQTFVPREVRGNKRYSIRFFWSVISEY